MFEFLYHVTLFEFYETISKFSLSVLMSKRGADADAILIGAAARGGWLGGGGGGGEAAPPAHQNQRAHHGPGEVERY